VVRASRADRASVADSLARTGGSRLAILGAGACNDIPLEEFIGHPAGLRLIHLVDLNRESGWTALQSFAARFDGTLEVRGANLAARFPGGLEIATVQADVTGRMAALVREYSRVVTAPAVEYPAMLDEIRDLLETTDFARWRPSATLQPDFYDVTLSDCVVSQVLAAVAKITLIRPVSLGLDPFSRATAADAAWVDGQRAMLERAVLANHVDALLSLTSRGGEAVLISDSVAIIRHVHSAAAERPGCTTRPLPPVGFVTEKRLPRFLLGGDGRLRSAVGVVRPDLWLAPRAAGDEWLWDRQPIRPEDVDSGLRRSAEHVERLVLRHSAAP